jgi:pimeloyl-ACP methyl ester carboxylesterase
MKRHVSRSVLLGLATLFFVTNSANAMFIDRFIEGWKNLRAEIHDAELEKFPLFDSSFFKSPFNNLFIHQGTFTQKLDHFDANDTRTFTQRYWVNTKYALGRKRAPVLYYICGEARCAPGNGFTLKLAKSLHAYVVTLEHRYYGDSVPTATYSAADLKFLSADQAIADLDAFQTYLKTEKNLKGEWFTVGGSYAGALSAFYRLTFPAKIAGALASSGPVQAKAEFEEYDYQVATVIDDTCLAKVQSVTAEIENDLKNPETREAVKKLFGSSEVTDDVDFLYIVADMAAMAIQYGSRAEFCSTISEGNNAKEAYAKIGLTLFSNFGMKTIEDTAPGHLSEKVDDYRQNGMRQWLYQSCTEFGFWQVAYHDPKFSSRSPRIDLPFHNEICHRMFGMQGTVDTSHINQTFYQPILAGKITNTFFTNGTDDPWQHLAINPARGNVPSSAEAMLIEGAAHCDDLGDPGKNKNVQAAQDHFRELLKSWLHERK